jgi:hypothetical protein
MKNIKNFICLLLMLAVITSCVTSGYHTEYMSKNIKRFSIPKRHGAGRHFIRKGKPRFNSSYTKAAKYSSGK